VYRGGDAFWAWLIAIFTDGLGLGYAILAAVGAAIAAIWAASGVYLGRVFNRREAESDAAAAAAALATDRPATTETY
jgi:AAA family ATP:ADP antiporter